MKRAEQPHWFSALSFFSFYFFFKVTSLISTTPPLFCPRIAKYPNAMKIDNSGAEKNTSWYKAFLGQRITDGLEKGIYVLTFYAKAKEAGTPVSVYIKQTNEEKNDNGKLNTTFFMRRDYDADAQPNASGAQYNFKIKDAT